MKYFFRELYKILIGSFNVLIALPLILIIAVLSMLACFGYLVYTLSLSILDATFDTIDDRLDKKFLEIDE